MPAIAFDNSYTQLPNHFFSKVSPTSVPSPQLLALNVDLANSIDLDADWLGSAEGLGMLSGNALPHGAEPIAQVYGGHQFGGWVPQLGDGRAILLGEVITSEGERRDVQLKGSGRTPYSRSGDGKSAIGPVIREYIVSEAMAALGLPTTRALAAVSTGEVVQRESPMPGGILTRVANSHIRVGTFQYFYAQNDTEALRTLADYAIARHYPEAQSVENPYQAFLESVIERQATLIARWMQLGFIHGVMNTDNMTISGETIDYGPCAFIDDFHPDKVFSSIDRHGRYAWSNQPIAGHWNLMRLAEALSPLLTTEESESQAIAEAAIGTFADHFTKQHTDGFCAKFGIDAATPDANKFLTETLKTLAQQKVDFTLFFRHLTLVAGGRATETLSSLFSEPEAFDVWFSGWKERSIGRARVATMSAVNPILIPRNHRVEEAIQQAQQGEFTLFHRLIEGTRQPYQNRPEYADLEEAPEPNQVVCQTFCGT